MKFTYEHFEDIKHSIYCNEEQKEIIADKLFQKFTNQD